LLGIFCVDSVGGGDNWMTHTTFLAPAKSSIRLCKGRTYEEYIIRLNATKAPICDLCEYLDITFDELRKIYDRVYNLPLSKIGRHKRKTPPSFAFINSVIAETGMPFEVAFYQNKVEEDA
jgi:hypothetical protein